LKYEPTRSVYLLAQLVGDRTDIACLAGDLLADVRRAPVDLLADAIARLPGRVLGLLLGLTPGILDLLLRLLGGRAAVGRPDVLINGHGCSFLREVRDNVV
jgi:hypothetical protein